MPKDRRMARRLAAEALAKGDAVGWHERVYVEAKGNADVVPWADMTANPGLVQWLDGRGDSGRNRKALVVGCGLGDDAEELAKQGYAVTAFDVSPAAIEWAKRRYPKSGVSYLVEDLFASPGQWREEFDLVLEVYTLQVLPPDARERAITHIAGFVSLGGTLLVISRGRDPHEPEGEMPWPLTKKELDQFKDHGLSEIRCEDYLDGENPPQRRFRIEYSRIQLK